MGCSVAMALPTAGIVALALGNTDAHVPYDAAAWPGAGAGAGAYEYSGTPAAV